MVTIYARRGIVTIVGSEKICFDHQREITHQNFLKVNRFRPLDMLNMYTKLGKILEYNFSYRANKSKIGKNLFRLPGGDSLSDLFANQ